MSHEAKESESSIRLLDALVVIAESWKLLLFFPLFIGLLTFGISKLQTPKYQSKAELLMLHMDEGAVVPRDLVIRALKLVPGAPNVDSVLDGLTTGKPEHQAGYVGLAPVTLTLGDAKLTPAALRAIVTEYQSEFLEAVRGQYKSSYQLQLDTVQQEIADRMKTINRIEKLLESIPAAPNTGDGITAMTTTLASLTTALEEREQKRAQLLQQMELLPKSLVTGWPRPATLAQGVPTASATLFAMLGAEMLALILLFLRDLVGRQASLPGGAEKIARLRRALRLRPDVTADQTGPK